VLRSLEIVLAAAVICLAAVVGALAIATAVS
jgi:hypothetical protein